MTVRSSAGCGRERFTRVLGRDDKNGGRGTVGGGRNGRWLGKAAGGSAGGGGAGFVGEAAGASEVAQHVGEAGDGAADKKPARKEDSEQREERAEQSEVERGKAQAQRTGVGELAGDVVRRIGGAEDIDVAEVADLDGDLHQQESAEDK